MKVGEKDIGSIVKMMFLTFADYLSNDFGPRLFGSSCQSQPGIPDSMSSLCRIRHLINQGINFLSVPFCGGCGNS